MIVHERAETILKRISIYILASRYVSNKNLSSTSSIMEFFLKKYDSFCQACGWRERGEYKGKRKVERNGGEEFEGMDS